jgi:hypothetical protein
MPSETWPTTHQKAFHQPPGRLKNAPTDYTVFISHDNEIFQCVQVKPGRNRFDLPDFNRTQMLSTAAEAYMTLGWSVIPLLDNLDPSCSQAQAILCTSLQMLSFIIRIIPESLTSQCSNPRITHPLFSTADPDSQNYYRDSTGWLQAFLTTSTIIDLKTATTPRIESPDAILSSSMLPTTEALRNRWHALQFRPRSSMLRSHGVGER